MNTVCWKSFVAEAQSLVLGRIASLKALFFPRNKISGKGKKVNLTILYGQNGIKAEMEE